MRRCALVVAATGLLVAFGVTSLPSCGASSQAAARRDARLLILGFDGVDPRILSEMLESGRLPNVARVVARGTFKPLETSMPPQSPVAWATFISGGGPGTHEIWDFVHRDPKARVPVPYLSTSKVVAPAHVREIELGEWRIPLSGGETRLLREGPAWWEYLVKAGIDTTVYRVPANYPASEVPGPGEYRCITGMGTPDLLGTYGEFTLFSPDVPITGRTVAGGRFANLLIQDDRAIARLEGPENFLQKGEDNRPPPKMSVDIEIVRDPQESVAKLIVGDKVLVLNEGEWSDWVRIEFQTGIPASSVLSAMTLPTAMPAIVRFYLKQVHPNIVLYVSPLNIDPTNPVNPISRPDDFATEVAAACGPYYTTGIPEDTAALRAGALNEDEFLAQSRLLRDERTRQFHHALHNFRRGCLFFYFGATDQLAHIFWRDRDPDHPGRKPEEAARYGTVVEDCYVEMDQLVGEALAVLTDRDTLLIMSDHGFTTYRRGFNLNTWLLQNGYLHVQGSPDDPANRVYDRVDWSRTRAYGLGFNCLYLNLRGRETNGIVAPGPERNTLLRELEQKLLEIRDTNGARAVERVYLVEELWPDADPSVAPDLLVGYADAYQATDATVLGDLPFDLFVDNLDRWSGTHLIAHDLVPGIIVANRQLRVDDPALTDLCPTILSVFGLPKPPEIKGRAILAER